MTDPLLWLIALALIGAIWTWWPPLHELIGPLCEPAERREMALVLVAGWAMVAGAVWLLVALWRALGGLVTR